MVLWWEIFLIPESFFFFFCNLTACQIFEYLKNSQSEGREKREKDEKNNKTSELVFVIWRIAVVLVVFVVVVVIVATEMAPNAFGYAKTLNDIILKKRCKIHRFNATVFKISHAFDFLFICVSNNGIHTNSARKKKLTRIYIEGQIYGFSRDKSMDFIHSLTLIYLNIKSRLFCGLWFKLHFKCIFMSWNSIGFFGWYRGCIWLASVLRLINFTSVSTYLFKVWIILQWSKIRLMIDSMLRHSE